MAIIGIWGQPGCPHDELALVVARRLGAELVRETALQQLMADEFGADASKLQSSWKSMAASALARTALERRPLVACFAGVEAVMGDLAGALRVFVIAPESARLRHVMASGLGRMQAKSVLDSFISSESEVRKRRFGNKTAAITGFDLVLNAERNDLAAMAGLVLCAAESGAPSPQAAARPESRLPMRSVFGHPSEEAFANLLDFYGISWKYEPKSFPLQWDKDGEVSEAFTPDFYLPDHDLYVELTTMKQSNVTRKNRKVRRLRAIYPHVKIEIFYNKDVQELITSRRLPDRLAR